MTNRWSLPLDVDLLCPGYRMTQSHYSSPINLPYTDLDPSELSCLIHLVGLKSEQHNFVVSRMMVKLDQIAELKIDTSKRAL